MSSAVTSSNDAAVLSMKSDLLPLNVTIADLPNSSEVEVSNNGTAVLADAAHGLDVAVQSFDTGEARVNSVLNSSQAPTTQSYELDLPAGARLKAMPDNGGYLVVVKDNTLAPSNGADPEGAYDYDARAADPIPTHPDEEQFPPYETGEAAELAALVGLAADEVPAYRIDAPWAVDAQGKHLPTTYTANGNTLTQTIDARAAVFP